MLSNVISLISLNGPMTCTGVAQLLNAEPAVVIGILRQGVEQKMLTDLNGFYDVYYEAFKGCRTPYAWNEGASVPLHVAALATGVKTCESVIVVAEVDKDLRLQGWPQFCLASIDIRLSVFVCLSTGQGLNGHVLRYLPLDTRGAGK